MTTLQIPKKRAPEKSRAETVRQRRSSQTRSKPDSKKTKQITRQSYRTGSVFLPVEPQPVPGGPLRQAQGDALPRAGSAQTSGLRSASHRRPEQPAGWEPSRR